MSNMGLLYGPPSWHHMIQAGMTEEEAREMLKALETAKNPDPEVWWQRCGRRREIRNRLSGRTRHMSQVIDFKQ